MLEDNDPNDLPIYSEEEETEFITKNIIGAKITDFALDPDRLLLVFDNQWALKICEEGFTWFHRKLQ